MQLADQSLRAAIARQQIEIDLGLTKLCMLCGNHIRTGQNQFVTATECRPVYRRNHGLAELLQRGKCGLRGVGGRACRLYVAGLADFQQFLDVGAGNKGAAGTRNHHRVDIILMLELLHDGMELVEGPFV